MTFFFKKCKILSSKIFRSNHELMLNLIIPSNNQISTKNEISKFCLRSTYFNFRNGCSISNIHIRASLFENLKRPFLRILPKLWNWIFSNLEIVTLYFDNIVWFLIFTIKKTTYQKCKSCRSNTARRNSWICARHSGKVNWSGISSSKIPNCLISRLLIMRQGKIITRLCVWWK